MSFLRHSEDQLLPPPHLNRITHSSTHQICKAKYASGHCLNWL